VAQTRKRAARGGDALVNLKILRRAALVGVVLELLLVIGGHVYPALRPNLLFGCMLIAGVAGLLYARDLARGFGLGALGGAVLGALCGVVAVGVSNLLGDRPDLFIAYGVIVLTLVGAIGGLFGQLDAVMKAFRKTLR
jgi:hypothetical protein